MEAAVLPDRRLLWALGISVAVHAAAVGWLRGPSQWSLRWPTELPRVLEVVMRTLPAAPPETRPAERPDIPRQAERHPRVGHRPAAPVPVAAPTATPVLTAPAEAPATEFRAPAAARPTPAAEVPARAAVPEPPVSAPRFDADYLENPAPAYPLAARRRGLQGTVRLEVLVGRDGRAKEIKLAESSGAPELDEAAQRAVREWRFAPARRGSDPIDASVIVPVRFQLERR